MSYDLYFWHGIVIIYSFHFTSLAFNSPKLAVTLVKVEPALGPRATYDLGRTMYSN
jgi:hypothetical protein